MRSLAHRTFSALAGCVLAVLAAVPVRAQTPAFEPDLLFHSLRHGPSQIYLADSNTGTVQRLRAGSDEDIDATWSPDGRQILFQSRRGTNTDLYLVDASGANLRPLTDHPGFDGNARWSPDGKAIAFISGRAGATKIFLMAPDGSQQRRLTDLAEGDEVSLSWSSDSKRLAFMRIINRKMTVWTMPADGSAPPARLTQAEAGNETNPSFSPVGNQMVHIGSRRGKSVLMLTELGTGSSRVLAAALEGGVASPVWSLDGQQLIVEGRLASQARNDVYAVSVATGEVSNLSQHPSEDMNGSLSPTGDRLALVSYRDSAVGQVHVQDVKSGAIRRLGEAGKHEFRPVWRPRPLPAKGAVPVAAGSG